MKAKLFFLYCFTSLIAFTNCDMNSLAEKVEYAKNGDGKFPKFTLFTVHVDSLNYSCVTNGQENTVSCELPYGVPRNNLTFTFDITEKGQMFINKERKYSDESVYDFTNPVEVMLKDWGGEESYYTITVFNTPPNGIVPKITAYTILLNGLEYKCFIDEEKKTITGSVPYGTDRSALVATFQTTENPDAIIDGIPQLSGLTANDYTVSRKLKLKDYEDEVNEYSVTIAIAPNTEALVYSFAVAIDGNEYVSQVLADSIISYVPYGVELTNVTLSYIMSDNASTSIQGVVVQNGDRVDMSQDKKLHVTAQNQETTRDYLLIVKYLPNTAASFSSFMLLSGSTYYNCTINGTNISVNVPYATDVQHMIARFYTSYGATVYVNSTEQTSAQTVNDLSNPLMYSVVSENGQYTQNYTVSVTVLPNHEANIITFSLKIGEAVYPLTIEGNTISATLPSGTVLAGAQEQYELSAGASLFITPGQNYYEYADSYFTQKFYRVVSSDGQKTQDYIVNITVLKNTVAEFVNFNTEFMLRFRINATDYQYAILKSVSVNPDTGVTEALFERPFGAYPETGIARFSVPSGAHVYINSNEQTSDVTVNDYTGTITFTVIAENHNYTKTYVISTVRGCNGLIHEVVDGIPATLLPNFNSVNYGFGWFGESWPKLKDHCGYEFDSDLNDDLDLGTSGELADGKSLRMVVNGRNIKDPYFNGGFTVEKRSLSTMTIPTGHTAYIDPASGKFALPGPVFVHTFADAGSYYNTLGGGNFYWNPEIDEDIKQSRLTNGYIYNKIFGGKYQYVETEIYPFGNDEGSAVQLPNGTMTLDVRRILNLLDSGAGRGNSDVVIDILDESTGNGFKIRSRRVFKWTVWGEVPDSGSICLYRYNSGNLVLDTNIEGITSESHVNEKLFITWNSSGRVEIYSNGTLFVDSLGSGSNGVQAPKIFITLFSSMNNVYTKTYNYSQTAINTIKIWREYFPRDNNWAEEAANETSVHPIYGSDTGYRINNITVNYFHND